MEQWLFQKILVSGVEKVGKKYFEKIGKNVHSFWKIGKYFEKIGKNLKTLVKKHWKHGI